MSYPFEIKKVYDFEVYPSSILGDDFQNVTILSILDFESALQYADIPALHVNVYPHLPSGTPDDPSQYDYIRIRTRSGATTILGVNWIVLESVQAIDRRAMEVIIEDTNSSDIERVRIALVQNGFNNISITMR